MQAAPYFSDVADGPETAAAHWVATEDAIRIRVGHWPSPGARATVLIFPGRTEYIEKYGRDARALVERGFAVATVDWRGQGLSDRLRDDPRLGHVGRFADYQADARALLAYAERLGLPKPYLMLAHSMGGCIGLRSLHEGFPVVSVVFTAPMWGIQMSPALRPIAWGLSSLSRPMGFSHVLAPGQKAEPYILRATPEDNALTSDPEMFVYMRRQLQSYPVLALGGPSLNWLNEALVEMRGLVARPAPDLPTLTFLGSHETIVDPGRITSHMAGWQRGRLVHLEGARHEVLMERAETRRTVFDAAANHYAAAA